MKRLFVLLPLAALCGCGSISGYDASSEFSCKAPEGVACNSLSGVYANSIANNYPAQREHGDSSKGKSESKPADAPARPVANGLVTVSSGMPLRSQPTTIRVWFTPYKDDDGDLNDERYVYITTDYGDWAVPHVVGHATDGYTPPSLAEKK